MKLTAHFTLEEFTVSESAARHGIDNTPQPHALENLRQLAHMLESVRLVLDGRPIIITSGYRSFELNRLVKGSDTSAHVRGLAADFICPGYGTPLDVCRAISSANMSWDQLIHEFGRWTHLAIGGRWRRETLTICSPGSYRLGIHPCGG